MLKVSETERLVMDLRAGCGPLTTLSAAQLAQIVAAMAPYGRKARDEFFARLRRYADRVHPCEYA